MSDGSDDRTANGADERIGRMVLQIQCGDDPEGAAREIVQAIQDAGEERVVVMREGLWGQVCNALLDSVRLRNQVRRLRQEVTRLKSLRGALYRN